MASWIAVASADHVRMGRDGGFMQVNHGRAAPLRRIQPGDRVAYYSPTEEFRGGKPYQAFTAIGDVRDVEPYRVDQAEGFRPWRRDIAWLPSRDAPLAELRDRLAFTAERSWGCRLRRGLVEIAAKDMAVIAEAMEGSPPSSQGAALRRRR